MTNDPVFRAIAGPGFLQYQGIAANWSASTNIWMTNVVAQLVTNGTAITFSLMGGTNDGSLYDVFATAVLSPTTNSTWVWLGQCLPGCRFRISGIPNRSAFFILGRPQDSDGDGLTDAYEMLISKTDAQNADTAGSGLQDWYWTVYFGGSTADPYSLCPSGDGWTLMDAYQNGWDPRVYYTPPPARDVMARLDSTGTNIFITWQAASGPVTNYEIWAVSPSYDGLTSNFGQQRALVASYDQEAQGSLIGTVTASTFSFADTVVLDARGAPQYCQYFIRANYANGRHADSPPSPRIGGGLNCAISAVRGPGGSLYLALGRMPTDLALVRFFYDGAWDDQAQQHFSGSLDIPASSFVGGVGRVPLEQLSDSLSYSWVGAHVSQPTAPMLQQCGCCRGPHQTARVPRYAS